MPYDFWEIYDLFFHLINADDGSNSMAYLKNELIDDSIETNMMVWSQPMWVRKYIFYPLHQFVSPIGAEALIRGHFKTKELWLTMESVSNLFTRVMNEWNKHELDVVITPGFISPAPFLQDPSKIAAMTPLLGANNILDLPGGVVPMTHVTPEDEVSRPAAIITNYFKRIWIIIFFSNLLLEKRPDPARGQRQ